MLPNKFVEALGAVLYIALNSGGEPVSCRDICISQGMSPRRLEPILQSLVKKGVLSGSKGPKGGYRLAREKRRITMDEILVASSSHCVQESHSTLIAEEVIYPFVAEINEKIIQRLQQINLDILCKRACSVNSSSCHKRLDFNI